ncbi:MAG TPA: YbdD/YjiX family protein [Gemmatimonadaceae bacterium]|jgi:uncharacterized short protein YbdD (DUF466 family)
MWRKVSNSLVRAGAVVRRIIGAPDYDTYLAHMRERHPDLTPMSRDRFMAAQLQARFDKPGARCC